MGTDTLTFGDGAAADGGSIQISLGPDTAADTVTFQGSIGESSSGGRAIIQQFDASLDTIRLEAVAATTSVSIGTVTGGVQITTTTATEINLLLNGVTAGLPLSVVSGAVEIG